MDIAVISKKYVMASPKIVPAKCFSTKIFGPKGLPKTEKHFHSTVSLDNNIHFGKNTLVSTIDLNCLVPVGLFHSNFEQDF